jgi:hypothetical protein
VPLATATAAAPVVEALAVVVAVVEAEAVVGLRR